MSISDSDGLDGIYDFKKAKGLLRSPINIRQDTSQHHAATMHNQKCRNFVACLGAWHTHRLDEAIKSLSFQAMPHHGPLVWYKASPHKRYRIRCQLVDYAWRTDMRRKTPQTSQA